MHATPLSAGAQCCRRSNAFMEVHHVRCVYHPSSRHLAFSQPCGSPWPCDPPHRGRRACASASTLLQDGSLQRSCGGLRAAGSMRAEDTCRIWATTPQCRGATCSLAASLIRMPRCCMPGCHGWIECPQANLPTAPPPTVPGCYSPSCSNHPAADARHDADSAAAGAGAKVSPCSIQTEVADQPWRHRAGGSADRQGSSRARARRCHGDPGGTQSIQRLRARSAGAAARTANSQTQQHCFSLHRRFAGHSSACMIFGLATAQRSVAFAGRRCCRESCVTSIDSSF